MPPKQRRKGFKRRYSRPWIGPARNSAGTAHLESRQGVQNNQKEHVKKKEKRDESPEVGKLRLWIADKLLT